MLFAFLTPVLAGGIDGNSPKSAVEELSDIIKDIDFDLEHLQADKVKVYFMVNSKNEVIVLRTNNEEVDKLIKMNLNYKTLKSRDLKINEVYTLPITFEKD